MMLDLMWAGLDGHWAEEADENIELFAKLDDLASSCLDIIIVMIMMTIGVGDWWH
jgi:hypothetical protein